MKSSLPLCHGQQFSSKLIHIVVLTVLCFFNVPISGNTTNPFTWLDCPAPPPSSSPTPPPPSSTNSTFQDNVFALLDALPSAAAPTGFAFLSRGEGTERAFVRGMCRGNSAPDDCAAYLHAVVLDIKGHCNTSRRAAIWYDKCFLSYADTNGSTAYEESFHQELCNYRNISDKYTMEFGGTYYQLMSRLLARAVNGSSEPVPAFATGHAVFDRDAPTPNGTIYGMVQCMRDLTAAECAECLRNSQELPLGVVLRYNCYLRMETYAYYDLALDASPVPGPLAPSPSSSVLVTRGKQRRISNIILVAVLPGGAVLFLIGILAMVFMYKRKVGQKITPPPEYYGNEEDIGIVGLDQLDIRLLRAATDNFSEQNKLGKGGFGEVFKGTLQSGEQIAVKRLSKHSSQGFPELKNEFVLAAKLKHKNLAPLVGVCLQEEKLLVYEYMPNSSLDTFLFDPVRRQLLDWDKRFVIIRGIARGLRYLHEESRLKVIHRDLKPSNVLLDADMNPKISDFGLARAFEDNQSQAVTKRPAGTLGYMSPEYAYCGHVSTKSDMFSFGVMVLEMVTGRKSNSTYDNLGTTSLLSNVWRKWSTGSVIDVVDPLLAGQYDEDEVLSCVEVGLLCVQENLADRPDASAVVLLLGKPNSMPDDGRRREPSRPAFFFDAVAGGSSGSALIRDVRPPLAPASENVMTISDFQPR